MVKNYKGGYKIIALAGISLVAGATFTIDGIHKSIEASYSKPLLIEGIVVDGVEKNAVWVKELKVVDGSFVIELYGLKLTITAEDEITVEESGVPTPIIIPVENVTVEDVEKLAKELLKNNLVNINGSIGRAVTYETRTDGVLDFLYVAILGYITNEGTPELNALESVNYQINGDEVTIVLTEI